MKRKEIEATAQVVAPAFKRYRCAIPDTEPARDEYMTLAKEVAYERNRQTRRRHQLNWWDIDATAS
ncbi:hypothetical protein AB8B21_02570 [Tardiphaga sp. 866_E4_N2_1]|jgi:hypothetical protein|uniref:hypothetical protein n=1 Tax=unclassified Tardiphaga TaxID=2631404 RepID=UPI003F25C30C